MRSILIAAFAALAAAAALPVEEAAQSVERAVVDKRGNCRSSYSADDYCARYCALHSPLNPVCYTTCRVGTRGDCTSHWNDGHMWAYKCSGNMNASRLSLQSGSANCWGDGPEYWCFC